jgi:hypothetical protein
MSYSVLKGQRFICQNPECGCEMDVTKASHLDVASNPRCGCGVEMKKPYVKPSITTRPRVDGSPSNGRH